MFRKLLLFILVSGLFIYLPTSDAICNSKVIKAVRPTWVIENKPAINTDSLSAEKYGGYYYLMVDIQENISKETVYSHYAVKLLNNDGVQNMSDIRTDFDPNYQSLTFHEINLYRNGIKINEMLSHNIKVIQRESDMERFMYDGRLTAYVNLEDIREGDIIEYSYSIQGYNPVNKGNYFRSLSLEYNDPVKEIYRRIIFPKNRKLYFNYPSGEAKPLVKETNNNTEYIWQREDVKSLIYDNNVPSWYNKNLKVELSTLNDWADVAKLQLVNYEVSDAERSKLKGMARDIFHQSDKDSVLISVIHFVQDKIRYLAFESGLNSDKPIPPANVMVYRYGDCKAKSLLLCSLLKLYDIDARPVLVNSNKLKTENQLPSPDKFNHCVVQINFKDKVINIDPTISNQGGNCDSIYFPDYGYGLVLRPETINLTPLANNVRSETKVQNYFNMDSIGSTVSYKAITVYSGNYADEQRSYMLSSALDETAKNYLKFYSKKYPHIRLASPLKYRDDRSRNLLTVEENYLIDSMWVPTEGNKQKLTFGLGALVMNNEVTLPSSPERTMPYRLSFPSDVQEDIFIELPEKWTVNPKKIEISDSLFRFNYESAYDSKQIHLRYNYSTMSDYVPANLFNAFYSKHQNISDYLNYSLTYTLNSKKPYKFSWVIACWYMVLLAVCLYFAARIYYKFNLPASAPGNLEIGGWLVLIAFGLGFSTIKIAYQFFIGTRYFDQHTWTVFWGSSAKNISMTLMLSMEFIYNSTLLVYLVLLQILFYKKRNVLPRLMIIFYATNLAFLIIDTILAYSIMPEHYSSSERNRAYYQIGQMLVVSAIWIPYFIYSKRVKETFTRVSEVRETQITPASP